MANPDHPLPREIQVVYSLESEKVKIEIARFPHLISVAKREMRNAQRAAAHHLLARRAGINEVNYLESGKPFSPDGKHISLSHSKDLIAMALTDRPVGIDIEEVSGKAKRVADKFLQPAERSLFRDEVSLTLAWCIKEAVFKFHGEKDISIRTDIRINSWDAKAGNASAMLLEKTPVQLRILRLNFTVGAWTL